MASTDMARVPSNASSSDESNCITVLPLPEDNESATTLTDRIPKQRSTQKRQAAAPKRSTSTRRSSRFVEEGVSATEGQVRRTSGNRKISGQTLVEGQQESNGDIVQASINKLNLDWTVDVMPGDALKKLAAKKSSKQTRTARLNDAAKAAAKAVTSAASVLGKRGRNALENGKEKIERLKSTHGASLRPRMASTPSNEGLEPATKKPKMDSSRAYRDPAPWELSDRSKQRKVVNRYVTKGLYAGQTRHFDPRFNEKKNRKRSASKATEVPVIENTTLPQPMFAGERLLENGRDFKLPFFVCNPLMTGPPKADEWKKVKKNRFVGAAADHWRKHKPLAPSLCMCTPDDGCGENCHNVMMYYECDDTNCNVGPEHCRNRNFADLKERVRKGGKFNIGVDVMMTADRGWGVRANRAFRPNQIIMEYAGEIITQEECENRMRNEYKDNKCYYLMEFEQGMIIDATRGSMARFVNHSCEPNCRMEQWKVNGEPRMALFAGDDGILVGEELTYDYNFDPFSSQNVQECRCGAPSCRGVLGPRTRDGPKPKKEAPGSGSSSSSNGIKRKRSVVLKPVDFSADEADRPAKRPKTIKEAARAALTTTKSHLTNALQATATTSSSIARLEAQQKAKTDKENDARAARLARRRSSHNVLSSSPSSSSFSAAHEIKPLARATTFASRLADAASTERRRHTLATAASGTATRRTKSVLVKTSRRFTSLKLAAAKRGTGAKPASLLNGMKKSQRRSGKSTEVAARASDNFLLSSAGNVDEGGEGEVVSEAELTSEEETEEGKGCRVILEEEVETVEDIKLLGPMPATEEEQEGVAGVKTSLMIGADEGGKGGNAFDRLFAGSRRARADEMQRAEMKNKRVVKKTIKAVESET